MVERISFFLLPRAGFKLQHGVLHELEGFVGKFNPLVYLVAGISQKLLKALLFFLGVLHTPLEIFFV